MTEIVFSGHDNKPRITVSQDGVAFDFAAVTRMTLALRGFATLLDSDVDADLIDWSAGSGVVVFDLGAASIPVGIYNATLVAYDALHPAGQVLAHPAATELIVRVVR